MNKPKTIEEVNELILDDSWVEDALEELDEEFVRIDRQGDKSKAPLASKAQQKQPEI